MSLMWNKNNQAWRLPDPSDKGEGVPDVSESSGSGPSEKPKSSDGPRFEIDFSQGLEPGQELSSLEVGSPGEFMSQHHDHGVSLDETLSQATPLSDGPSRIDGLVMVDEPLPVSLGGGSAAVQDMFVQEVLKGAQSVASNSEASIPSLDLLASDGGLQTAIASPPLLENQGETVVFSGSSESEKTVMLPETRIEIQAQETRHGVGFENTGSSSGLEATLATAVQPLAVKDHIVVPDSPRVADLISQGSAIIEKPEARTGTSIEGKSKAGSSEKTKSGAAGKSPTNTLKEKSAATVKKNAAGGKGVAGGTKTGAPLIQPQSQLETNTNFAPTRLSFRQLPKDARIALGTLLASIVLAISLVAVKRFQNVANNSVASQSTRVSSAAEPVVQTPSGVPRATVSKSAKPLKASGEQTKGPESYGTNEAEPVEKVKPDAAQADLSEGSTKASNAKHSRRDKRTLADEAEDEEKGEESSSAGQDKKSETFFALTRPTSRYAMDVKTLAPLFDASVALDRVQPRKVQNLLRQLPKSYAASDAVEKNAIREITARYYLQVGALTKAMILFSQACPDPGKTSDVEICLHAARGMLMAGNTDELKETIGLLRPRLVEKLAEWRDWLRLLEVSNDLSKLTLESFVEFTDEMIDKGPFMTSEWNLQLSGHFAKILMNVPHKLRIDYLKTIAGNRRKMFEIRLAPEQFGLDIGSYMFPSLLNLLLRHYEMPALSALGEEAETDSEFSLMAWVFNVIAQSNMNEPRQTRARLAPLFGEKSFAPLARIIEGHLAAQAVDFQGAAAMISEQIGVVSEVLDSKAGELNKDSQGKRFLLATQRLREFPFLYVEWLFLGVKVASGLSDKELMKTVVLALEDARRRFPELKDEIQYWIMLGRGYRLMGYVAGVEAGSRVTEQLASTPHELGFAMADRIWVLMQKRKVAEAKALMRKSLREIAYHARLLELGAEFAAQWSEDPSSYLKLEQQIPKRYENRGRDRTLLSFFTIRKLLSNY